jgi:hypothetical protein
MKFLAVALAGLALAGSANALNTVETLVAIVQGGSVRGVFPRASRS